ncbi:DNA-binding NtrC family response regulator [Amaricoccus macauensis]|uniref:DNA-binding NtrC family response regulator n=1 Tax=Amaricoccus macauensis TaxID=57001 RepID=A0A840SVM0_9RHOB|nr:hypothetical protein [Amaricoccus macauensis]MBB5223182.1 DNA-binding NtrC family response regulator [Amaricoccus macauensis]
MDSRPPGGTLILKIAVGASSDLVEEVATAVARGYLPRIGDDRAIPIDVRLLVASGPALEPVAGLTRFELPPLADPDVPAILEMVMRASEPSFGDRACISMPRHGG